MVCYSYACLQIKFLEKRNIKPYNDTLAAVSTAYSKNLELDIAEDLAGKISDGLPKYIHPFNAILAACDVMVISVLPRWLTANCYKLLLL